jgi:hypothetical protein
MSTKQLTYSITGVSAGDLDTLTVREAYNSPVASAVLSVTDTTLGLGDAITINIGFDGSNVKVFRGYVSQVNRNIPGHLIGLACEDELARAVNFFIASDDPENPLTYSNIQSEDYVEDILKQAWYNDLGSFSFEANVPGSFTWATDLPAEVNLLSAWQGANEMAQLLAWHIYADRNGKIWFVDRKPYIMGGDSNDYTWNESAGTNVISVDYTQSTEETRNKVVVYGRAGIQATASAARSDLYAADYYKTAVIGHPLIQTQAQAQTTADYNLTLFNRPTETVNLSIEGNANVTARQIGELTMTEFTSGEVGGDTSDWFIYQVQHQFGARGFTTNMTLTK